MPTTQDLINLMRLWLVNAGIYDEVSLFLGVTFVFGVFLSLVTWYWRKATV